MGYESNMSIYNEKFFFSEEKAQQCVDDLNRKYRTDVNHYQLDSAEIEDSE